MAVKTAVAKKMAGKMKIGRGLVFQRVFSKSGVSPFDEVKWDKRKA